MLQAEDAETRPRRRIPAWLEFVLLSAFALGLALLVKTFLVQMFFVPSESMKPELVVDDKLLVEKVSLWGDREVERGDIVVFSDPGGWLGEPPPLSPVQKALSVVGLYPTGGHLVKRVIAVGGDTVECCDDKGRLTVNDDPLEEDYLPRGTDASSLNFSVEVPEGRLWVMGDNRSNSEDSRYHRQDKGQGTIPESAVVGRVWAVVWPWSHADVLDSPKAFDDVPDPGRAAPTLH
jgi:signal peptidase I